VKKTERRPETRFIYVSSTLSRAIESSQRRVNTERLFRRNIMVRDCSIDDNYIIVS
jgi:hypothetical protein